MPLRSEDYLAAYRAYRDGGKEKKPPEVRLYGEWRDRTIEFLKGQYGDGLRSVVLHYDEEYLHLHFFAGNKVVNGTLNLDGLDCASDAERALGMDRKARNASGGIRKKVRTQALKKYQVMYYETVARFLGWARVGPKNPRMTSQQYAQHKRSAADLLAEKESTATAMEQVERLTTKLTTVRRMYKEATEDLAPKVSELLQLVKRLKYNPEPALLAKAELEVTQIAKKLRIKI